MGKGAGAGDYAEEKLSEYELERLRRIKENNELLAALHIPVLIAPEPPRPKAPPRPRVKVKHEEEPIDRRKSKRVRGLEPSGEKAEPRVRAPKFEELYEEETRRTRERVVTEESYANRMERAQHQHLGLIGLSPAKSNARKGTAEGGQQEGMEDDSMSFSISGSRGNVYTITIAETPKCTCPDQRIRKVMCKHILFTLLHVFDLPVESPVFARKGPGPKIKPEELREMLANYRRKHTSS